MKLKYIIIAIQTCLLFASCDKFLDEQPKGVVIPTTLDDYEALLSAPLEISRTSVNQLYGTDEIILPESLRADATSNVGASSVRLYDFEAQAFEGNEDDLDWNVAYRTIYIANSVLKNIDQVNDADITRKNRLKGEAQVHRAFTYLMLVNTYAKHYSEISAATDLGVPLPLTPDINVLLPRSSVKDVYVQIESDLKSAYELLANTSAYNYRPNKAAAAGLLARMYLYQGKWDDAYFYADKALAINSFLYDYNTLSWVNPASKALSTITGIPSSGKDRKDIILLKYGRPVSYYFYAFLYAPAQFALYKDNDLRKELASTDKDWYNTVLPYPGIMENKPISDYNTFGVTTEEVLLTKAEAGARKGDLENALTDLNKLRVTRIKSDSYSPVVATNQQAVIDSVMKERRIELAFKGFRLFDIKRLYLLGENTTITRDSKTYDATNPRLIVPIAEKVINLNNNIIQNPR